jgi:hypothetical protein
MDWSRAADAGFLSTWYARTFTLQGSLVEYRIE